MHIVNLVGDLGLQSSSSFVGLSAQRATQAERPTSVQLVKAGGEPDKRVNEHIHGSGRQSFLRPQQEIIEAPDSLEMVPSPSGE